MSPSLSDTQRAAIEALADEHGRVVLEGFDVDGRALIRVYGDLHGALKMLEVDLGSRVVALDGTIEGKDG